eukprot:gene56080-397_t
MPPRRKKAPPPAPLGASPRHLPTGDPTPPLQQEQSGDGGGGPDLGVSAVSVLAGQRAAVSGCDARRSLSLRGAPAAGPRGN